MKYTHVLWDFNGTVLDDVGIGIESVNILLKKRGIPEIAAVEHYRDVFGFPIVEYYKRIGFDFSKERFSDVAVEWVGQYMSRVFEAKVNRGAREMLEKVKSLGLGQVLVSATEIEMLKKQIGMLGVSDLFDEVYGLDNIHANDKISVAKCWRTENASAKALFVGDTDHDFETANTIGADCVLFSGGHQSEDRLRRLGVRVISDLFELEKIILGD